MISLEYLEFVMANPRVVLAAGMYGDAHLTHTNTRTLTV